MSLRSANSASTVNVRCAFCQGTGRDPFGVMSPLSTCQVCGGTGRRMLRAPTATCPFCGGTGVHPHTRLTCTVCGGVGTVSVPDGAVPCPCCGGSGRAADYVWPDSPFPCSCCGGKGAMLPSVAKAHATHRSEHDR
jgi:DnaJ-class molecular chaperone